MLNLAASVAFTRDRALRARTAFVASALATALAIAQSAPAQSVCSADVDDSGTVNAADLSLVLANWGPCADCSADVDGDDSVSASDISFVLANWGGACQPTVLSVTPNSGPLGGGTTITISGNNLYEATGVAIGGVAATVVQVVNDTLLTAVTPRGAAGPQTVSVTTPNGTVILDNAYTYTAPWYTVVEQNPDPSVVTSATVRAAIAATGYPWRVRHTATQIEMLLIPPGTFSMGCSASNDYACGSNESPVHSVTLTSAFYIGRYEVTQAQWLAKMGSNPSYFQATSSQVRAAQVPNRPVEQVSWNLIAGSGGFLAGTGLRLPTEAEWEFACRGGTATAFHGSPALPAGTNVDSLADSIAWLTSNSLNQTRPVGGKAPNGFGLHDMSGNVWEWVSDWYAANYYASSPSINPTGPAGGSFRVLRGGSWYNLSGVARSSYRGASTPDLVNNGGGFRVAKNP